MAQILCILALLCFASCAAENTETQQEFKNLQLQQDSLAWFKEVPEKQELTLKQNLIDLLSKLFKPENGIIQQGPTDPDTQEKKRRGVGSMTTQSRKAGCRAFFWKSWTAC